MLINYICLELSPNNVKIKILFGVKETFGSNIAPPSVKLFGKCKLKQSDALLSKRNPHTQETHCSCSLMPQQAQDLIFSI